MPSNGRGCAGRLARCGGSAGEDLLALLAQLALRPDVPVERHGFDAELPAQFGHRCVAVRHCGLRESYLLLMNETGRRVREQYADTGGFTDHVFAACSRLGYAFVPRLRALPSKRLYVFARAGVPKGLRPLVGGKVNADLIGRNWADILRVAATMAAGTMRPSQTLRSSPRIPPERAGERSARSRPR